MNTLKKLFILFGLCAGLCLVDGGVSEAAYSVGVLSAVSTGVSAASINSTPSTNNINMGIDGYYTRLSLLMAVTWGTTTTMNVTCQVSMDNSTWYYLQRCTSAATHDCGNRTWQWVSTDGTDFALDVETNGYPYIKCTFDDPGAGNGTVTVQGIRGR